MKHAAYTVSKRSDFSKSILQSVTLVDDAIQAGFGRNFEMLPEQFCLSVFVTNVVFNRVIGFRTRKMP